MDYGADIQQRHGKSVLDGVGGRVEPVYKFANLVGVACRKHAHRQMFRQTADLHLGGFHLSGEIRQRARFGIANVDLPILPANDFFKDEGTQRTRGKEQHLAILQMGC